MNFDLSEEQVALQDSLGRLLSERHDHEQRRRIAEGEGGCSESLWRQVAALGITALPVPEAEGGLGGRGDDLMVVMKEIGRSLLASPLVGSCILPAVALRASGEAALAGEWLPQLAEGARQLAWAHDEPEGDGGARWVSLRAAPEGAQWRLSGSKLNVHHAASADHFLVTARTAGQPGDEDGRALFIVAADAAGLAVRHYRLIDGTPAAELSLDGVAARPLCLHAQRAGEAIESALASGIACAAAEMVGAMEAAIRLTAEYLNTRKQFGRVIGQNQALRHKLADMQVSLEMARSMALGAAVAADRPLEAQARVDLRQAKIVVGRHARSLAQTAIQLHGGIGMTQEYAVGHFLRRIHVLDLMFGDSVFHASELVCD